MPRPLGKGGISLGGKISSLGGRRPSAGYARFASPNRRSAAGIRDLQRDFRGDVERGEHAGRRRRRRSFHDPDRRRPQQRRHVLGAGRPGDPGSGSRRRTRRDFALRERVQRRAGRRPESVDPPACAFRADRNDDLHDRGDHGAPAGHASVDDRPQSGLVRRRFGFVLAERPGLAGDDQPGSLPLRRRNGRRDGILAQQPGDEPPGHDHQHPRSGEVLERADGEADVRSPGVGAASTTGSRPGSTAAVLRLHSDNDGASVRRRLRGQHVLPHAGRRRGPGQVRRLGFGSGGPALVLRPRERRGAGQGPRRLFP